MRFIVISVGLGIILINISFHFCLNNDSSELQIIPNLVVTNSNAFKVYLKYVGSLPSTAHCMVFDSTSDLPKLFLNHQRIESQIRNIVEHNLTSNEQKVPAVRWIMRTPTIHFKSASLEEVLIEAIRSVELALLEVLRIECVLNVGQSSNVTDLKKPTRSIVAYAVSRSDSMMPINWTTPSLRHEDRFERPYLPLVFTDHSRCPCDLLKNICDINCCCDLDCDIIKLNTFECEDVLFEDLEHPKEDLFEDFNILLCVVNKNSPYLGTFYKRQLAIIRDIKTFKSIKVNRFNKFVDAKTETSSEKGTYFYGTPMHVRSVINKRTMVGQLSLPMTTLNGKCSETSPVRFLISYSSKCLHPLTAQSCSSAISPLSSTFHLSDNGQVNVLVLPNSHEYSEILVKYHCSARKLDGNSIVKNCTARDSFSLHYDVQSKVCQNVINDYYYKIFWNGSRIVSVQVDLLLIDVDVRDSRKSVNIISTGRVDFIHASSIDSNHTVLRSTSKKYSRDSGYEFGTPLLTGFLNFSVNGSNDNSFQFDARESFNILSDSNGFCIIEGGSITFGINKLYGCRLGIPIQMSTNCTLIRLFVSDYIERTLLRSHVSKNNNQDNQIIADFLQIRSDCDKLDNNATNDEISECLDVSSHVVISVLYSAIQLNHGITRNVIDGIATRCYRPMSGLIRDSRATSALIMTSLEFVKRLVIDEPSRKSFWIKQDTIPCSQDSCWSEILHPWTSTKTADELSFVIQWTVSFSAVFVILLFSLNI